MNLFIWLLFLPLSLFAAETGKTPDILKIEIRGTIDPATSGFMERAIKHAEAQKMQFLLIELDTPGGLVSSVRQMAQSIDKSTIPVVTYVTPAGASATSAGALLMISSHIAVMAPGTNIGAAHPVGGQGEEIKGPMADKAVNDVSAFARSMAELRGRNAKLAEEVVSKSKSYSADEALKANLIDFISDGEKDLLASLHQREVKLGKETFKFSTTDNPKVVSLEMSLGEQVLHYLAHPNVAAILMTLGFILIYAELSAPGLGLPGILGALCLFIAFIAFQVIPIHTGGLTLLLAGMALVIAEVFLTTGGALALGGSIAFILGLLWFVDTDSTNLTVSFEVWLAISITFGFCVAVLAWAGIRMKRLNREALQTAGSASLSGLDGYVATVHRVNDDGLTGQIFIRGELWNFKSKTPVQPGAEVLVTDVQGLLAHVEMVSTK